MIRTDKYFVNVWVTLKCNFSCRYCYVKPFYENVSMDEKTADQMIEFIKRTIEPNQHLIINFHGGEPTINYNIVKYIIETSEKRLENSISFGITTNGSLLSDEMIDYLSEKCDYNLSISIDGKKETHNKNREAKNPGHTYESIFNNAKKLLKKNEKTRIRMTFDKDNVDELYENVKMFIDEGYIYIVPSPDIFSQNWEEEDFLKLEVQLRKIKEYAEEKKVEINLVSDTLKCLSVCTAGHDYYSIDPDGNIYPCTFLVGQKEMIIGSCNSGIDKEKLKMIDDITSKPVEECMECTVYDKCLGARCVFTNYVTNGDFYKPNLVECNMLNLRLKINGYID